MCSTKPYFHILYQNDDEYVPPPPPPLPPPSPISHNHHNYLLAVVILICFGVLAIQQLSPAYYTICFLHFHGYLIKHIIFISTQALAIHNKSL